MRRVLMAATLLLAACGQAPTGHVTTSASPATTMVAHFVVPEPSAAKMAALKAGGDGAFSDFVAFHEVGLRPGQSVSYRVTGSGKAAYSCMRTNGTLNAATGSEQEATGPVSATQTLVADASGQVSAVITLRPPPPANPVCPNGYAMGSWRASYTGTAVVDEANNVIWSAPDVTIQT